MTTSVSELVLCRRCPLSPLCLPANLQINEKEALENILQKPRALARNAHLFRLGEPFQALYIIRTGTVKSYTIGSEGNEHINAFHFPAELIGFDGFTNCTHAMSAIALEDSTICTLPFEPLLSLTATIPSLQRQLFLMISQSMRLPFAISLNSNAETRFAAFLFDISHRLHERGLSSHDFELSMSREEIGNYLGLATETISRLFHGFQEKGILAANRRTIHVDNLEKLNTLSSM